VAVAVAVDEPGGAGGTTIRDELDTGVAAGWGDLSRGLEQQGGNI
jgi:hypothetical protein